MRTVIDETAKIHPSAKIADNVEIGPWTIIGANVEIGEGTKIESHVVIKGPTKIGRNNHIFQFVSMGEAPQFKKYAGEPTYLQIGDDNVIREFCTIHRGTAQGLGRTIIGNRNFIMAYVHIAHDCTVGNDIIFANNAALSGHVVVNDFANFGGFSAVHQYCNVGAYCFVAGETSVGKDVPPYILVSGHPATIYGLNLVGLKRNGFSDHVISQLKRAYNIIYRQGFTTQQALLHLEGLLPEAQEVQLFINALSQSTRGIVR